ncbi:MAG: hypothetical protein ACLQFR_19510 [Streptosporangiaceae bacterium]
MPDVAEPGDAARLLELNARLRELAAERDAEIAVPRGQVAELERCGRRALSCGSGRRGWSRRARTWQPEWG